MLRLPNLLILFWATSLAFAQSSPTPEPDAAKPVILKTVELDWEAIPDSVGYEVRLTPQNGEAPLLFSVAENHLQQRVPLGFYALQVRARTTAGESPWSSASDLEVAVKEIQPIHPEDKATLKGDSGAKQTVEFRWSPVEKIREYTLKVWSESKKDNPWIFTGKTTVKKLEVPPGEVYYWQVSFESANDVSYQQEPKTFSFILQGLKLVRPEIQANISRRDVKSLGWKTSPGAEIYRAKLFFRHLDEIEWTLLKEEQVRGAEWPVNQLKAGAYKVEVTAMSPRRTASDPATREFVIKPTQAQLDLALQSLDH